MQNARVGIWRTYVTSLFMKGTPVWRETVERGRERERGGDRYIDRYTDR